MENVLKTPLTNLQLELLKVFSHNLSESELKEIKALLLDYFSKKAISAADKVWESENWDEEKLKSILNDSERTPYGQ
ncbi:hypothetical protein GCM10027164_19860 [Algoriphagus taiwanensis]|uniref:Addiction module component n=1 Tax=Algoriphagus taiwanensis TaxID=1445656 RepID=A0ABQ6PWX2_9BACT|nr:hypothetical protein Ataiwa_07370 [Algoriphagus taiwanensis]